MTSTPTLRGLLRHPELHLAVMTPEPSLPPGTFDRTVQWVHSSDLSDPTPFLADDLVLLTTGSQFAQRGPAHQVEYVARLVRRGIVALGFGTEVALPETPRALLQACRDAGLPLFAVPYQTPFIAVARAHAEAMAAQGAGGAPALRRQRRTLQTQLLASLLDDDPALARRVLGTLPASPFVIAVAAPEAAEALERWADESGDVFAAVAEEGCTVVLDARREGLLDTAAARLGLRLGISTPAGYAEFSRAHRQARAALRHGSAGVTRFADTAVAGLSGMLAHEQARLAASGLLSPLDAALTHSLRVWLAHDARLESAAAELGIHRHTLRARVARAAELLGRDLGTFAARAELWAALQAIR